MVAPAGTFQLWGQSIQVDWAQPEKDVEEEVMQRVRVLYVSQLMAEHTTAQGFSTCLTTARGRSLSLRGKVIDGCG